MVNLIYLAILGAIVGAVVFFRKEIGETAGVLGQVGTGIQGLISGALSPQIRPSFVPTIGFDILGFGQQQAPVTQTLASRFSGAPRAVSASTAPTALSLNERYRLWKESSGAKF